MNVAASCERSIPGVLGKMLASTRSLADAEDAVQDAIERALVAWPAGSRIPRKPGC